MSILGFGLWASSGSFPLSAHYGLYKRGRDPPTNPSRHLKKERVILHLKWLLKEEQGGEPTAATAATATAPPRAAAVPAAEAATFSCLAHWLPSCSCPAAAASGRRRRRRRQIAAPPPPPPLHFRQPIPSPPCHHLHPLPEQTPPSSSSLPSRFPFIGIPLHHLPQPPRQPQRPSAFLRTNCVHSPIFPKIPHSNSIPSFSCNPEIRAHLLIHARHTFPTHFLTQSWDDDSVPIWNFGRTNFGLTIFREPFSARSPSPTAFPTL